MKQQAQAMQQRRRKSLAWESRRASSGTGPSLPLCATSGCPFGSIARCPKCARLLCADHSVSRVVFGPECPQHLHERERGSNQVVRCVHASLTQAHQRTTRTENKLNQAEEEEQRGEKRRDASPSSHDPTCSLGFVARLLSRSAHSLARSPSSSLPPSLPRDVLLSACNPLVCRRRSCVAFAHQR